MQRPIQIAVVGGSGVGKTSFCRGDHLGFIGNDVYMIRDRCVNLLDFDPNIHSGYDAVIFLYDTTDLSTLCNDDTIHLITTCDHPIVVFGNKDDLVSGILSVAQVETIVPASVEVFFGSCVDGRNVVECIQKVIDKVDASLSTFSYYTDRILSSLPDISKWRLIGRREELSL